MINKFISLLLTTSIIHAETSYVQEICKLESSEAFGYTGDVSGKRVNTKEEFTYKCIKTFTEQGECKKWETTIEEMDFTNLKKGTVHFETEDYSGSMGAMLSITQAYDKINGLWSGWHGLCQTGMDDGNWDWMSDPYVLAGYAISAYAGSIGAEGNAAAEAANTSADAAVDVAMEQAVYHDAANQAIQNAAVQQATANVVNMSICAVRAGIDVSKMIEEYEDDGEPCDNVDEFCDGGEGEIDSEVFTLPESKLNDLLNNNPDMADNIEIISGEGTGTVTVKVVNPGSQDNSASMAEAEAAAKKMKELMLKIRAALMTVQLAGCMLSNGNSASSQTADPTSTQNLTTMGIGMISPYAGIAVDVAFNTYASLQKINTCTSENDAKEKGKRHISTLKANRLGQCHFIEKKTSGSDWTMDKRSRYRYCCYDDKITRIMVEQSKAQLAKDWQHCTDISLRELQFLNFKACDPQALDASGKDGTKMSAYASLSERFTSYQYVNKCIDTREYMNYMLETFAGEDMLIDTSDIEKTMEDLK